MSELGVGTGNYTHCSNPELKPARLYAIWSTMINRCYNPNYHHYKDYGGRGITVCKKWKKSINFMRWAKANGYKKDLQIDRRNNDGNYCPKNCRFVTASQNSANRRKRKDFGIYKQREDRYRVIIRRHSHNHHGGYFSTVEEARIVRDKLFEKINKNDKTWQN